MPLFVGTWTVLEDYRSDYPTLVASLEEGTGPDNTLIGRWHNPANYTGMFAVESPNAKAVHAMIYSWSHVRPNRLSKSMIEYKIQPMLDDNMLRKVVLQKEPSWVATFNPADDAVAGESLFWGTIKLSPENKLKAYTYLARETNVQSKFELGNVRMLARYHDVGAGITLVVVAASSETDLYQSSLAMTKNWAFTGEIEWVPVLKDEGFRNMIQSQPGFKERSQELLAKYVSE